MYLDVLKVTILNLVVLAHLACDVDVSCEASCEAESKSGATFVCSMFYFFITTLYTRFTSQSSRHYENIHLHLTQVLTSDRVTIRIFLAKKIVEGASRLIFHPFCHMSIGT